MHVMEVLSANGLSIRAELSYRYRPIQEQLGYLHNEVGANYHERINIPRDELDHHVQVLRASARITAKVPVAGNKTAR